MFLQNHALAGVILASLLSVASVGCNSIPQSEAQEESKIQPEEQITAVDVAIAKTDSLEKGVEYIGTTQPLKEVALRSQVEGQLLNLTVDVGDRVTQGELLAQLDEGVLQAAVSQAQAELAALQSEVTRTQAEVTDTRSQVESAKVQLQQAKLDNERSQLLFNEGAIAKQQVELAKTELQTAQQTLVSAQSQVEVRQSAVKAAIKRVSAQQAFIEQAQKRFSYTRLTSPITGYVLQRVTDPGNLVQPGGEILRIGDFSRVKVLVKVSELQLEEIRVGQSVKVRLDAFPKDALTGQVNNISPAADAIARQIPIEVTIPNPNQRFGSGLLARVSFTQSSNSPVIIPQTALETTKKPASGLQATIFVVVGDRDQATVRERTVSLGKRRDGKVEVLAGLIPGERFVTRSSRPLKHNEPVRLSFLSKS